ncbi:MAG: methionyl-tRNA synthetase, methionyl-tRNA synthetase [Candidatus Peregrinibacteria bacterium GW2011_GWE2_39_6]|nr:MAG: methionyl-tRNA synthetase, methionyl-tRNA synthetase [Candidatus Peregrinibacteria bacterium GW2011_GWF2_39_17]KKR24224.1 MAG: methionyl-tRNA synthetase, methionyl-tRNA synthetase [Candidatus Peregrinibacteria bacterium GW2011_GWE2_39_6]
MSFFYITTTLPYVNAEPHIGFALEIIQADAIARYQRLLGKKVFFNTGTDEHGLKIYRKAQENGQDPKAYCDEYAAKFDALKQALNLSYTNFVRTTDEHHVKAAQEFWQRCAKNGDIYKKKYKIKYCVGCELEKTDSELSEEGKCPVHPNLEIENMEEENYFFRFSRYQKSLLEIYRERPDFVLPAHRLMEVKKFTEKGLEDFSISRLKDKMPWGIPVPDDDEHVMYVWFDALINYISTLGWPEDKENFAACWPGVQIAGKDNLRQQSNMWQGMLLSAGLRPSHQILIHGFITSDGQKMSKSLGNVVDPFVVAEQYGIDALRFYLLKEIPTTEDGDFNQERFKIVYDSDLANNLGNLVSRVMAMNQKYYENKIPIKGNRQITRDFMQQKWQAVDQFMVRFDLKQALEEIGAVVNSGNRYIEEEKPWALEKAGEKEKLNEVMYVLLEGLRQLSWMLEPFIPQTSQKIREQLGVEELENEGLALREWGRLKPGTQTKKGEILFPRVEILK